MATTPPSFDPNFVLLYVENPTVSAAFYAQLLGRTPVDASVNFAMFALGSGVMLGLWARADVQPTVATVGTGGELGFAVADKAAVEAKHGEWSALGLSIVQAPTAMDFGYTFTAVDPDGHRLRVFAPGAA